MIPKKVNKLVDMMYRDERFRTEGGSDDERVQQRWQELLQHDSEDEVLSYAQSKIHYEKGDSMEEEDGQAINDKSDTYIQSFFKNTKPGMLNKDFVNVFIPECDEDSEYDDLDDYDLSEKYRDETLRLSSHGTNTPKTIASLQDKFRTPTNSYINSGFGDTFILANHIDNPSLASIVYQSDYSSKRNKESLYVSKAKENSIRYTNNANLHGHKRESRPNDGRKDSFCSKNFNEMDFSENVKDLQMKKLVKYTLKKNNLMSKLNTTPKSKPFNGECKVQESCDKKRTSGEINAPKSIRKVKHERIKSLDFSQKSNFETFFDSLWGQNKK